MARLLFGLLLAYVLLDAWAQGGITGRNRLYVPPAEQPAINADHHGRLALCYALACALAATATRQWPWLLIGGLLRLALFDAVLNARKKDPLFSVGSSAWSDRLLARVPWANPALRVLALAGAVALTWYIR